VAAESLFKTPVAHYESAWCHNRESGNLNTEGGFYRDVKFRRFNTEFGHVFTNSEFQETAVFCLHPVWPAMVF
jgi:hypothetical protein